MGVSALDAAGTREIIQIEKPHREQLQLLPKNLSRWHMGARLLIPDNNGGFTPRQFKDQNDFAEATFLKDDETEGVPLERGIHDYVIDLNNFVSVSRFSSPSFEASGRLTLRTSDTLRDLNENQWIQLGRDISFKPGDIVDLRFPLTDTRYLWVQLEIDQPGEFGNFNAMGMVNLSNVEFKPVSTGSSETASPEASISVPYDYATLYSGARITHVSGGDPRVANFLIDDDILTYYEFPNNEEESLFILDLGSARSPEQVSFLLESGNGTLEVYPTDKLPFHDPPFPPESDNRLTYWTDPANGKPVLLASAENFTSPASLRFAQISKFQSLNIPGEFLSSLGEPLKISVEKGNGKVRIPMSQPEFRYLIVRWASSSPMPIGIRFFEVSVIGPVKTQLPPVAIRNNPQTDITEFSALSTFTEGPLESIPPVETDLPTDRPELILPDDPPASL